MGISPTDPLGRLEMLLGLTVLLGVLCITRARIYWHGSSDFRYIDDQVESWKTKLVGILGSPDAGRQITALVCAAGLSYVFRGFNLPYSLFLSLLWLVTKADEWNNLFCSLMALSGFLVTVWVKGNKLWLAYFTAKPQ